MLANVWPIVVVSLLATLPQEGTAIVRNTIPPLADCVRVRDVALSDYQEIWARLRSLQDARQFDAAKKLREVDAFEAAHIWGIWHHAASLRQGKDGLERYHAIAINLAVGDGALPLPRSLKGK